MRLLLALGLVIGLSSVATAANYATIEFGTESSYAPFEYKNEKGELAGFDIDVGNAICQKLNAKCVWTDQSFDSLIPSLQARKFDVIHASLTHNAAREKVIAFSDNLYAIPTQLVAKKGSGTLPTVTSLKGKKVGVLQGSAQEAYARKAWGKKGIKIVSYLEQEQTFIDLLAGRVDVALLEKPNALAGFLIKEKGKDYEFVGRPLIDPLLANEIGLGFRKQDKQLRADINGAIKALREEGTLRELAEKYFQPDELELFDNK